MGKELKGRNVRVERMEAVVCERVGVEGRWQNRIGRELVCSVEARDMT
jgi:hypothetical protein